MGIGHEAAHEKRKKKPYGRTYGQVEQPPGPGDADQAVHVLEHGPEHLVERRRRRAPLRACTKRR